LSYPARFLARHGEARLEPRASDLVDRGRADHRAEHLRSGAHRRL